MAIIANTNLNSAKNHQTKIITAFFALTLAGTASATNGTATRLCSVSGGIPGLNGTDIGYPVEINTTTVGGVSSTATFMMFGDEDPMLWTDQKGSDLCGNIYGADYPERVSSSPATSTAPVTFSAPIPSTLPKPPCATIRVKDKTIQLTDGPLSVPEGAFGYHNDVYMFYRSQEVVPGEGLTADGGLGTTYLTRYTGIATDDTGRSPACYVDGYDEPMLKAGFEVIAPAFNNYDPNTNQDLPLFWNMSVTTDDTYVYILGKKSYVSYSPLYIQRIAKSNIDAIEKSYTCGDDGDTSDCPPTSHTWSTDAEYWTPDSDPDKEWKKFLNDEPAESDLQKVASADPAAGFEKQDISWFDVQQITLPSQQGTPIQMWLMVYNASGTQESGSNTDEIYGSDFIKSFCSCAAGGFFRSFMPFVGFSCPPIDDTQCNTDDDPPLAYTKPKVFYRLSSSITGPWSKPVAVDWPDIDNDGVREASPYCAGGTERSADWLVADHGECATKNSGRNDGILYGIHLLPPSHAAFEQSSNELTHYAMVSTWNPYEVHLIEMIISVDSDDDGIDDSDEALLHTDSLNRLDPQRVSVSNAMLIAINDANFDSATNEYVSAWGWNFFGSTYGTYDGFSDEVMPKSTVDTATLEIGVIFWLDETGVFGCGYGCGQTFTMSDGIKLSGYAGHICALSRTEGVKCDAIQGDSEGKTNVPARFKAAGVIDLAAGVHHTCAIDGAGVGCWGESAAIGEIRSDLVAPSAVAAGESHTCVIDGLLVKCWGDNTHKQLDVPTSGANAVTNPLSITAGNNHTCVLNGAYSDPDSLKVICWGDSAYSDVPTALERPIRVEAGGDNTCAVLADRQDVVGSIVCWPKNLDSDSDGLGDSEDLYPFLKHQTITVTNPAPQAIARGATFTVGAEASSGLDVTISSSGDCTGSGLNSATILMSANAFNACQISYEQAGNSEYSAADSESSTTNGL